MMTPITTTTRQRLGILATACLLSVALPTAPALAQKTKTKSAPSVEASVTATSSTISVDIPTIDAVASNVDEATLRAIFSGNVVDNAAALAGLSATSITIPEITLSATTTVEGKTRDTLLTFTDLVLSDIIQGTAATVSLAGMSVDSGDNGGAEFGTLSASNFNIGGVLGMYGLVDAGGQSDFATIYSDFAFAGGTLDSDQASCTMGAMTAAEFKARPLHYSFAEIMALAESLEAQGDDPSPETVGAALHMYVDLFTAFESSPVQFNGFDCSGVDDEERPMHFSIAGMTMGGMRPGTYPTLSMDGLDITVEDDGSIQLGNFTFKGMDLTGPIAAIKAAPAALDEAWFEANMRSLIPAFAGFSFSDVAVDVPDPQADGERIKASIGAYDLSLADYLNGIPTNVMTTASNILVNLPQNSDDAQLQQLIDLGLTSIDAGFALKASWNAAADAIAIDELSVTGANLATVKLAGTIANATEALFGLDQDQALLAAMGVAISKLKLDVTDAGLYDLVLASVAAEQGADPATLRPVFAGLAEGTVVGLLAGAAEAQKVGGALNDFVSGKAKNLTIELTAKEVPGLSFADFMAAESDPTALIGKVIINASAK